VVEKILKDGKIVGLKYLSSNPIVNPDTNKTGIGVVAEFFQGSGGDMFLENTYFARISNSILEPIPTKAPETLTVATTDQIVVNSKKTKK
jgi:hypothetical protein